MRSGGRKSCRTISLLLYCPRSVASFSESPVVGVHLHPSFPLIKRSVLDWRPNCRLWLFVASQPLPGYAQGIPLAIKVRDEALAKTKRPYDLLAAADLTPVASETRGEMISRATPQRVQTLAQLISTRTTKADTFAISTFETFRVWDPVIDAIPPAVAGSAGELLDAARRSERTLRIELFPWLSVQSLWDADGATLAEHLTAVGLPVFFVAGTKGRTALYLDVTDDATEASIQGLVGIRSAILTPSYGPPRTLEAQGFRQISGKLDKQMPPPDDIDALVGVFDSGIAAGALDPWVARRSPTTWARIWSPRTARSSPGSWWPAENSTTIGPSFLATRRAYMTGKFSPARAQPKTSSSSA